MKRLGELGRRLAPGGSFRANVLTLMTGTALGQLLLLAVSPLLTRLFAPSAFGAFGVYLSLASILGALSTLRFDQALMLPKDTGTAAALFWAALLSACLVAALSLAGGLVFFNRILSLLKVGELSGWILLLPLSILLLGAYTALNSWSTRHKKFARSSAAQMARALAIAVVQVGAGLAKAGPAGLVGGALAGDGVAALVLARQVRRHDGPHLRAALRWPAIRRAAGQFRDFPLFSSPQNLLNAISQNIPVLLLAKFFGPAVAGYYVLAVRSIQIPMNFLLTSLRQVFFQKASETCNSGGDAYALFRRTTLGLLGLVALPTLAVMLFGPRLFAFVLGREWGMAGEYARWLVSWLALMFANVPAVLFAQIYRRQRAVLLQDVLLLALRVLAIVVGGLRRSPWLAVALYSAVGVAFNMFIILWAGNFVKKEERGTRWAS
jgi:lipopolysaccharide exporter